MTRRPDWDIPEAGRAITGDGPFGHTPAAKALHGDVYGIARDEERAGRRKVRLVLLGAGGVAQAKYLPSIARLKTLWEPVDVVGFAEPRAVQGQKVAETYGVPWFADVDRMLDAVDADAALVLSPDPLHAEHTLACLDRGLHVLVEKPITTSLVDAAELCRAAERAGRTLMVVANKRFSPPYRRAKRLIAEDVIGPPARFTGKFDLGYDYVDLLEGGTIHLFDLCRYLMGDVTSVCAFATKRYPELNPGYPLDNATAVLAFESGAVGSLATSATALSFKPWERVEVVGRHAWLAVEDQYELIVYRGEEDPTSSWKPAMPNTLLFDEEFGGYVGLIENFLQCVRGSEEPVVTGWDGYRALELLRAVQTSLVEKAIVSLPLDPAAADALAAEFRSGSAS